METSLRALAFRLFDCGAILDKSQSPNGRGFRFKLHERNPDAPLSPIRLNLRTPNHPSEPGPLTEEILCEIAQSLYEKTQNDIFDAVVGIPYAGEPLAESFARINDIPIVPLKKEVDPDTQKRRIAGIGSDVTPQGEWILVLDDLITQADSKLETIHVLEEAGYRVHTVVVIVDRLQGGSAILEQRGYEVLALFTLPELIQLYHETGRISNELYAEIIAYLATNTILHPPR